LAKAALPQELSNRLAALRATIDEATAALAAAEGADLVSASVIQGLTSNLAHRFERLERRFVAAVKRRGNDALRDVAIARASLFPGNVPQERALNIVPLLARHGDQLLDAVRRQANAHAATLA
ncbi:MAG: bacillithiol biosynthesis BshC, partial [Gemmatimonadaceae bacterium]|nr:bacillithiol biosynthesis BshC [Gemmatimonadaceae bacterium]